MRLPFFGRGKKQSEPKPIALPSEPLPEGEEIEQQTRATLLYGKQSMDGVLHMTNRRLLFEAKRGDAKWMSVPYAEITSTGLYPWPGASMGMPSSRQQCLVIETVQGEQVWWDFGEKDEREWLPRVQKHVEDSKPPAEDEG